MWVFDSSLISKLGAYVLHNLYGDSVHVKFKISTSVPWQLQPHEREQ